MMNKIDDKIYIGGLDDCRPGNEKMHVIHACKDPCHKKKVGYSRNLHPAHQNYLYVKEEHDLFLNIIDPPIPLFMPATFRVALSFAESALANGADLLIHCNAGLSRAPSIALLIMAKITKTISNANYYEARTDLDKIFGNYAPGTGISAYLHTNWFSLDGRPQ